MARKRSSLAPIVALVLSVAAGTPSAFADEFKTESAPTTNTGSQQGANSFDLEAGTLSCSTAKYVGTMSTTSATSFVVSPQYSGCTFAGLAAEVSMNGCSYVIKVNGGGSTEGTGEISCPAGKDITFTWPPFGIGTTKCTVHVAGGGGFGLSFTNIGSGTTREFIFHITAGAGFSYSQTPGSGVGACSARSLAAGGKFTGSVAFTAESGGGSHVGIFLA